MRVRTETGTSKGLSPLSRSSACFWETSKSTSYPFATKPLIISAVTYSAPCWNKSWITNVIFIFIKYLYFFLPSKRNESALLVLINFTNKSIPNNTITDIILTTVNNSNMFWFVLNVFETEKSDVDNKKKWNK